MNKRISRRDLLKLLAASAGAGVVGCSNRVRQELVGLAQDLENKLFLPSVGKGETTATPSPPPDPTATPLPTPSGTPGPLTGKVVHVHDVNATNWDYLTGWYGDYIDQNVVNTMVDNGIKELTGQTSVVAAWQTLLPGYASGKKIAIKVNFNTGECESTDNDINAVIEPVNALIRGMGAMGVLESDIWICDPSRPIPTRFTSKCLFRGVHFVDNGCPGNEKATFASSDPNAAVNFNHPNLTPRRIADVTINASYLINIPLLKDHAIAGVTLGFKNHFGTIIQVIRSGEDNLHYYIRPSDPIYSPDYSPMLDIFVNPHLRDKTVLTVGDGLFGYLRSITPWQSFGNDAPNSLFFAIDPVAIDCVMLDILDRELNVYHPERPGAEDYLKLAANAGLGVYERGNPGGAGYSLIDYRLI